MFEDSTLVHGDIVHTRHVYYIPANRTFTKTIQPSELCKHIIHIKNPVFSIETLHFCYVHMIENVFRCFWIIQDMLESKELKTEDITFFIRRNDLMTYATLNDYILAQYFSVIDVNKNSYRGAWNDIFKIVNKNDFIFESFIIQDCVYLFEDLYVLNNDEQQHSFWNSTFSHPSRTISPYYLNTHTHLFPYRIQQKNEFVYVRYLDTTIKEKLAAFRKTILDTYLPEYDTPRVGKRKAIIIHRKDKRVLPESFLQELTDYLKSSTQILYTGMYFLEELNFQQQLALFNTNDVFFMVHGAGCANILWAKKNSILFQYDSVDHRFSMYNRLAELLDIISYNILLGVNHFPELLTSVPL